MKKDDIKARIRHCCDMLSDRSIQEELYDLVRSLELLRAARNFQRLSGCSFEKAEGFAIGIAYTYAVHLRGEDALPVRNGGSAFTIVEPKKRG